MIPTEKQVLMIQGGKALEPSHRICNYSSAGTVSTYPILHVVHQDDRKNIANLFILK